MWEGTWQATSSFSSKRAVFKAEQTALTSEQPAARQLRRGPSTKCNTQSQMCQLFQNKCDIKNIWSIYPADDRKTRLYTQLLSFWIGVTCFSSFWSPKSTWIQWSPVGVPTWRGKKHNKNTTFHFFKWPQQLYIKFFLNMSQPMSLVAPSSV